MQITECYLNSRQRTSIDVVNGHSFIRNRQGIRTHRNRLATFPRTINMVTGYELFAITYLYCTSDKREGIISLKNALCNAMHRSVEGHNRRDSSVRSIEQYFAQEKKHCIAFGYFNSGSHINAECSASYNPPHQPDRYDQWPYQHTYHPNYSI